jgi:hypothetical protein
MNFTKYDLGQRKHGDRIEVRLRGSAANVRLMDSINFNYYKNGKRHKYIGGLIKRSPCVLQIPHSGHWFITVDLAGMRGTVESSIHELPNA